MSNRQRHKPPSQRRSRESRESVAFRDSMEAPELDVAALGLISRYAGVVSIDGEPVPLVLPHTEPADHATFDSLVCAAGLKRFLRPRMESDRIGEFISHVLVVELAPRIRVRTPIEFYPDGTLN